LADTYATNAYATYASDRISAVIITCRSIELCSLAETHCRSPCFVKVVKCSIFLASPVLFHVKLLDSFELLLRVKR